MTEKVHVGTGKGSAKRWVRPILIALAVVLVAGGAGVGARLLMNKKQADKPAPIVAPPLQKNVDKAIDYELSGEYDAAHKEISDALAAGNLSTEDRFDLLVQRGLTYSNQEKHQEALTAYQEAAKVKETQSLYEAMAEAAQALGNKEAAISYYKKAIQLIPEKPTADDDKDSYEQKIRALGGQP